MARPYSGPLWTTVYFFHDHKKRPHVQQWVANVRGKIGGYTYNRRKPKVHPMSTFKVEIVPVDVTPHPNADRLGVVSVFGYTCCVTTKEFEGVRLAAYIPPDSLVDTTRAEFSWLKNKAKYGEMARVKVQKLRGVVSMGLLIPARAEWEEGQDVAEELGVQHYNPPAPVGAGGEDESGPPGYHPKYDVENLRRYQHLLVPKEDVVVTEKIHGCNARFCWVDDRIWAGSRSRWKKYSLSNLWWRALAGDDTVSEFCQTHPEITIYGEIYGQVQDLKYGSTPGDTPRIVVFDLLRANEWVSYEEAKALAPRLPWVPELYKGPYDEQKVLEMAEGRSIMEGANHVREGVVVKPLKERSSIEVGRVFLKVVGNSYLERAK